MPRAAIGLALLASLELLSAFQTTFRSSTRLVQINVLVHDKTRPVPNLTKQDFVLTDAGKARNIALFSVTSSMGPSSEAVHPLPANTFSNRGGPQQSAPSVTVVLLDRLNTLSGPGSAPYEEHATWIEDHALANARQHLIRFLEGLKPNELVAIYSLGNSIAVLCDFTSDRERLRTAVENYRPVSITRREDVEPLAVHTPAPCCAFDHAIDAERRALASIANRNRAETTLGAIASIAAHVSQIPGRKNLVWLTANLPFSIAAIGPLLNQAGLAVYPVDARGLLTAAPPLDQEDAAARVVFGRNGVANGQGPQPTGIASMEEIARDTGGRAYVNSNDLESAIRQAVKDGGITYSLGFYVDEHSLDGKFHQLKVSVKQRNYDLHYPRGYFASRDPVTANRNPLMEAIIAPLESQTIGLTAQAERDQRKPGSFAISGAADLHNLELDRTNDGWRGALDVYIVQQDAAGVVLDQSRNRYNLQLTDRLYADYLKTGIFFRETIAPHANLATLRILVANPPGGSVGSLIIPVAEIR